MASSKSSPLNIRFWAPVITAAGLPFIGSQVASAQGLDAKGSPSLSAAPTPGKAPPLPVPGPLAQPRSLKQVGLPIQQTLAEIPPDDPQTPEKIALGEKLFFEPRLSADGTVACASCHNPERAFTDGKPASVGIMGRVGQRNAPTILNALYNKKQFWDGRSDTLEDQAALPITNPTPVTRMLSMTLPSVAGYFSTAKGTAIGAMPR